MPYPKIRRKIIITLGVALALYFVWSPLPFCSCFASIYPTQNSYYADYKNHSPFGFFTNLLLDEIFCFLSWLSDLIDHYHDILIALATIVIAYFTYTLWKATHGLRRLGIKQSRDTRNSLKISRDAADAATLSAMAAIRIELPILRAILVEFIHLDAPIPKNGQYCGVGGESYLSKYMGIGFIHIKNLGRTNAIPISYAVGWQIAEVLPDSPVYTESGGFNHAEIIKPEGKVEIDAHFTIETTDAERDGITKDITWLWFYGSIKYLDFMEDQREARFCWRLANRNPKGQDLFFTLESDGNPPESYIRAKNTNNIK